MSSPELRRRRVAAALALSSLLATGCIENAIQETWDPTRYPITETAPPPPATEGSIWRGTRNSGSFLAYDRKARGIGDLVTVEILENLSALGAANTTVDGTSQLSADLSSDIGWTDLLQAAAREFFELFGVAVSGGAAAAGQTVNIVEANRQSTFEGDGETSRESRFRGTVTCRVVEVLPGDVYRIHGRREILLNHELQLVTIEGLVRRIDIGLDNRIASTQVADARLTFDGLGVLDDKQRVPLIARVLDWITPF